MKYTVYDIQWDMDGNTDCVLPTETEIVTPTPMTDDEIGDWLSNRYGFCHKGFCVEFTNERTKPNHTKCLNIPAKELDEYETILTSEGADYDDMKIAELSTIKVWTVKFDDGCFVDLKVNSNCRSDGDFYAEAVLFDKDGCQLDFSDPQYDLKGVWNLSSKYADYTIEVKGE